MTRNKAQKRAARERAAATGERYVVARRTVLEQPETAPDGDGVLHRLTHRVPGAPAHVDGGLVSPRNRPHVQPRHEQPAHHHGEPRVLVGWQNRIARLFGARPQG